MLDRDILRVEATAELQAELDKQIRSQYPVIQTEADLSAYQSKQTNFVSIRLQKGSSLLAPVIDTALQRAADPQDPAFCSHANLHGHFQEVVTSLREAIENRKISLRIQPTEVLTTIGDKQVEVTAHRLVVEAHKRIRPTFRPGPHQFFLELEQKLSTIPAPQKDTLQAKIIRRAAEDYGVPFAILVSIYSGLTAGPMVQLFQNAEARAQIREKREQAGVKNAKIPANNPTDHTALHKMVRRIRETLIVDEGRKIRPSYFPPHYFEALQEFDSGYLKDFSHPLKEFVQTNEDVTPRAVFLGLDEEAQLLANTRFVDPYRAQYIDKTFWPYATTKMITAYFDAPIEPSTHHFSHTINGRK